MFTCALYYTEYVALGGISCMQDCLLFDPNTLYPHILRDQENQSQVYLERQMFSRQRQLELLNSVPVLFSVLLTKLLHVSVFQNEYRYKTV